MKDLIKNYIVDFVKEYEKRDDISTSWRFPASLHTSAL